PLFFNQPIGPHRRIHSLAVPLQVFKDLKTAYGATVNDVVLAVIAEGLADWLADRGETVPDVVRVFCPVSVRDDSQRYRLGNMVSGMVVDLPTGVIRPEERIRRIATTTGDLKRSRQAV